MSLGRLWLLSFATLLVAACGGGGNAPSQPAQGGNAAPVAAAGADQSAHPGDTVTMDGSASHDTDGTVVQYAWTQIAGPTVTLSDPAGRVTTFQAPPTNGTLVLAFRLTVTDNRGATGTDDVQVTVVPAGTPTNRAPVANDDSAQTAPAATVTIDVLANDTDPDGAGEIDPASIAISSVQNGAAVAHNGKVDFTPAAGFHGQASFQYAVNDIHGAQSNLANVRILVTAANHAPVADATSASGAEDSTITGQLTGSDVDGDALTFAIANPPAHGTASVSSSGAFTYTPAANYNGSDAFTFTVNDGRATSAPATVSLSITPVNDMPVAQDATASGDEDQPISGQLHATDVDSPTLTYSVVIAPAAGSVAIDPATGAYTYTPSANYNGIDSFQYQACDDSVCSGAATVRLTINAVDDAPFAFDGSFNGTEDRTTEGTLSADDVDSQNLTYRVASQPAHGSVRFDGAHFTYTPVTNFAGSDSFTFVANDGQLDSNVATVSLNIADTPEPHLNVDQAVGSEQSGQAAFQVSLSGRANGPVTVSYHTVDGTAKAGKDYTATSGSVTFDCGPYATQYCTSLTYITVPVIDDDVQENTESFSLSVTVTDGADNVEEPRTVVAQGTILDNDDHGLLRVGAGKHSIQPTDEEIAGIDEGRLGSSVGAPSSHKQFFNLGGFGINPMSDIPDDPAGLVQQGNDALTAHATRRVFTNHLGVKEEEMARAFVIEQKDGTRVAFVMFDAVGAGNIIEKDMTAAIVAGVPGLQPENVIIGMTHSHTASDLQGLWGGVPQQWIKNELYPGAVAAVRAAMDDLQPARLRVSVGINNDYNSYRRPKIDPNADADGHMTLLVATADDGTPIGSILQYAAHPTGVGSGNKPRTPHPDFILGAADWLESHLGGGTALYYNGPIADASGSGERPGCNVGQEVTADGSTAVFGYVRCKGEGIADAALGFFNAHSRELAPTLETRHVTVTLPVTNPGFLAFGATGSFNRYYDFAELPTESIPGIGAEKDNLPQLTPTAKTEVSRVTIGGADSGLEIVTIPGEGTNTFGEYIRGLAKTDTMLLGLTHNSFGYIIPEDEFSYVDQEGDDGLVAPWTGYEENVSLGPLTAPILRSQAYNVLFGVGAQATAACLANAQSPACVSGAEKEIPPTIAVCLTNPESPSCIARMLQNRVAHLIDGIRICIENGPTADGCPLSTTLGYLGQDIPGAGALPVTVSGVDTILAPEIAKTATMGCDFLDPSECHFPFPNDFFTTAAAPGSPQSVENGGTGKRINFNILGMPRNAAGKPIDPTEWNRNDGFSPGQMVLTYVPNLKANADGTIPGAVTITDVARSYDADAPIFVIDADTGERQLIWAEADLNANLLEHGKVVETDQDFGDQQRPLNDGRVALIVRPAKNFAEGHRYIVALRNLKDRFGKRIVPGLGFQACTGQVPSLLRKQSPMKERCDHIGELIDTLAHYENDFRAQDLYLTWDFTIASAKNDVGRLAHMRDVAFNSLALVPGTDCTQLTAANVAQCAAPTFAVDTITDNPQDGIARRIEGTLTVPSFVTPVEPTPGQEPQVSAAVKAICNGVPQADFTGNCNDGYDLAGGATLPPNRLFYSPADGDPAAAAADPSQAPYGDGMPDTVGNMQTRFICQIPQKAFTEPARASIYGHGLLDSRMAVTYEGSPQMQAEHNFMYCAVDLFGFATGDLGNVASSLVDISNFPVVPDGSQQGLLNYMFLARAMRDPKGFAANTAFQNAGKPLFDTREIFYNGNSQGGIVGGAVLAISKDINRGVLGSLGMNYSTLLQRSKDFDPYSVPVYTAYTDPLDRMFVFSMMQMLWDRSENDGYAEHLTQKSDVEGGPVDHVLLNSMYGDQQVTMWSAEVMARTMGIHADYGMVPLAGKHHPDLDPAYPDGAPSYYDENGAQFADESSALFNYAAVETDDHTPIGNQPHRAGPDPHDNSHRRHEGRCQISHWLQRDGGRLLNLNTDRFTPWTGDHAVDCPAVHDNSGAPGAGTVAAGGSTLGQLYAQLIDTINSALAPAGQQLADALSDGAQQLGQAIGIYEPAPGPGTVDDPAPQPLVAGAAKGLIRVPVGTPLGGYLRPPVGGEYVGEDPQGELTDNIPNDGCDPSNPPSCIPNVPLPDELRKVTSPYATYSPPSRGYYDSLTAKAVAMYDGHDYVVLVKTDFIGMLDEVVQDVKARVKADTHIDLGDGLIMSATHTHDGPGALANNSTRYFWLAMDVYQHDVYLRVVGDLAAVVENALGQMKPAKIGHATGLDQLGMNHYRRGRFAYYKDNDAPGCNWTEAQADCNARDGDDQDGVPTDANELRRRIGVLELQDVATRQPIALVVNFQAHGIAFDVENQYFSGDVLASLEREVEQGYRQDAGAGTPITMFVQGTNGDVTPSADYSIRGIEQWGKKIAPEIRAIADRVDNFDSEPNLRTVSQRIVLNRHTLGYKDGEYPYPYGAAQCGNDIAVPYVDIATGAVHDATGLPEVPTDAKDIPGWEEQGLPTMMPYCIPATAPDAPDLADNGVAENGAFVPGDTILSAVKIGGITLIANPGEPLTEYGVRMLEMAKAEGYNPHDTFIWGYTGDHVGYILPPVEADWATFGGAESTTTFWGWKQGERFINVQKTLLEALRDGTAAPADEFKIDYSKYRALYDAKPPVQPTPSVLPGSIMAQPADIKRLDPKTTFVFEGGDPVVDFPRVTMQHADGTPVLRANGEVMDTEFEMHLKYRFTTGRHLWTVEFEAPRDWAAGSYKFHVEGVANQGVDAPYAVTSKAFAVAPATDLQLSGVACGNGVCTADLKYKAYPSNYRIVDYRVSAKSQAPVRGGTVTFTSGGVSIGATTDDNGHATARLDGAVTATGRDVYGNTAPQVTAQQSGGPDSDGDGVPDASDQCPNTPAGTPVDGNGCPVQSSGGFPLCEDFYEHHCLDEVPVAGPIIQGAVDTVYNTVTGGGVPPPPTGGVPDQCDPTGTLPDSERCLSQVPVVGGMFGDGGSTGGGTDDPTHPDNASCATSHKLDGGRSYQVKIPSDSGETISFQVLEPTHFNCAKADKGAHPLIIQGHGFGGSRSTSGFTNFRDAGYTVISFDQRGHGDSTGTIRVLDPDVEGKDLVKILDWAETNLDYLAYRDESRNNPKFVARPANGTSVAGGVNLLLGSIGGSYGGGFQTLLHAVDTKNRLDAMAPDITWHDLRWSLNPGDVLKSGWDLLLVAGGDKGSYAPGLQNGEDPTHRGLDPYIDEVLAQGVATGEFPREALAWFKYHSPSYWCELNGQPTMDIGYDASAHQPVDPNMMALQSQNPVGTNRRSGQPPVNVLFSQGFRDTLFNFNDAWANYQCFKARAGANADVRLITHESGHIFSSFLPVPASAGGVDNPLDFENTAGTSGNDCGKRSYRDAQFGWFEEKLRGAPETPALLGTEDSLCVSLTSNESVDIPATKVFAPGSGVGTDGYYAVANLAAQDIPEGTLAQQLHMAGQDQNAILPLLTVTDANGLIVAGIAQADLHVTSPQMANDAVCDAAGPAPTLRAGCDSIVYLSLAKKGAADSDWTIIDDQSTPVRGLGTHAGINLIGVAERLQAGDQLALIVRGYSPQYLGSYSRDATLPVVNISASLRLPLYAVGDGGQPRFDVSAAGSVGAPSTGGGGDTGTSGGGLLGLLSDFTAHVGDLIKAAGNGDAGGMQQAATDAATGAANDAQHLGDDPSPEGIVGEDENLQDAAARATRANRDAQAVVITGSQIPDWSVPEARGVPNPYPSGSGLGNQCSGNGGPDPFCDPIKQSPLGTEVRSAHNGTLVYPAAGAPVVPGVPVEQIAAYAYKDGVWTEIPVQVDERMPYFLANANSDFGIYSGTDQELTYVWDTESWGMTAGTCKREYDTTGQRHFDGNGHDITGLAGPTPDPVPGLDNDDEIAFMASDAGDLASGQPSDVPAGAKGEQVAIADPLDPSKQRFVYLFLKPDGSKFRGQSHYVKYQRDANADQWVDSSFFEGKDAFHRTDIGTSNTGYGPNLSGTVCDDGVNPRAGYTSDDRFPRDGVTVSTDAYQWHASGRWMVREMHVAKPGQPGVYGPDLIDRWKGRAFQQSPDTNVSVVGFEDEQVNWEANSTVLGERAGPVRAIREIWGADSGTNVTKTETFYRDAVAYRYHVRVHPIPPDGLYTSWDYNRGAMVSDDPKVPGGRYFTILRPRGVPIDGKNDDIGQVDSTAPIPGIGPNGGPGCFSPDELKRTPQSGGIVAPNAFGVCPIFFDAADPTFNLPLAFDNWEQVSGKGDNGSLVYTFENKGPTSYTNPLVVPFYRDDQCLDDGTGDDPVARPYPGERSDDSRVTAGYSAANGGVPYAQVPCSGRQGAFGEHGVHYFFTHDSDNAFSPVTSTEIDGQQWQFAVPTDKPKNVAEPYANTVRVPLQVVVTPVAPSAGGGGSGGTPDERGVAQVVTDFVASIPDAIAGAMAQSVQSMLAGVNTLVAGVVDLFTGNDHASALAVANDVVNSPGDAPQDVTDGAGNLLNGFFGPDHGAVLAGVGVVDMTPDVGYCAGQYCDYSSATVNTIANGVSDGNPGAINDVPGSVQQDAGGNGGFDPYVTAKTKKKSYGVQSRETTRAIVVQGSNGKRIALLKTDNYLAQDNLLRRVGQLLDADGTSGVTYDHILYGVTHDHSATYNSTLAFGPMLFEDAYDSRAFEYQARQMAKAIELAAADHATDLVGARGSGLKPARMGATVAYHSLYKGNVVGLNQADDGTPAGYPYEYNDHQVTVMRFDATDGSGPIATWINWGQHGEGNDGYDLHSADFVAALERMVERETGAPLVYSQGDVGSSENSANHSEMIADDHTVCGHWFEGAAAPSDDHCAPGEGTVRDFDHHAYAANERNVRFLADDIRDAWTKIGAGDASVIVPMSADFPVDSVLNWVPGPVSHPYPSVSNCRTEPTAEGDPGSPVLGLPDCQRAGTGGDPTGTLQTIYATMKAEGVPVPDHYDATGFEGVEENHRIKLQAFRLGDVLLASCACEAQDDLILNLKSRTDTTAGNIYDGFDWACLMPGYADDPQYAAACDTQKRYYDPSQPLRDRGGYLQSRVPSSHLFVKGNAADDALVAHMRAEVHNDARGWDLPENAVAANSEPTDPTQIWGNFTKEEIQDLKRADGSRVPGFKLPVGVGHAGDYNGYTVSYREYMNRDSYRKALTTYGPHTADYMVTRLVRMAAQLQGGPHIQPEPLDTFAQADELRQQATAIAHGQVTAKAYEAYYASLPPNVNSQPKALVQPADIGYFNGATFTWQGGSTAVDNPIATVERCVGASDRACTGGIWQAYADGSGEVQTRTYWPQDPTELAKAEAGDYAWKWTANFEAYESFPSRLGATPPGFYRFVVYGCTNTLDIGMPAYLAERLFGLVAGADGHRDCKYGSNMGGSIYLYTREVYENSYTLVSSAFEVVPAADVISAVQIDGSGNLSFKVSPTSIPRTYTSAFDFIADLDGDGNAGKRRLCDHCSFRPWATSDAAITSVTVQVGGRAVAATNGGDAWTAATSLAAGETATISVTYADGRVGRAVSVTRAAGGAADADGDGVPDASDQCPTQAGTAANGCPAGAGTYAAPDADGDGVLDNADACPGTAAGVVVDAKGCSSAQRDSDGDGIYDGDDICPTIPNPAQNDVCVGEEHKRPAVIVAVADTGVNPYHKIYYRPDLTAHPCTYIKGFDCSIPALNLSIGKYKTWQEAFNADRDIWAHVELHKWYWIPKTNIIGAVCNTAAGGGAVGTAENTANPQTICILDDSSSHGTETTSSVLQESPDALLLVHEGDGGALDLPNAPVIPDVQSHSWAPSAPLPTQAVSAIEEDADKCSLGQGFAESLFFLASGNEALFPAPADGSRFCPSAIVVGGGYADSSAGANAGEVGSWTFYDFASWYCRPVAQTQALDGYTAGCGTSFAAPTAAGTAAQALLEIRRGEGYVGRSSRTMVSGTVSREQFMHGLRWAATYHPTQTYHEAPGYAPIPLVPGAEYLVWGWGWVDHQIVPDLVACARDGRCPAKADNAVQWNQNRDQARQQGWETLRAVGTAAGL